MAKEKKYDLARDIENLSEDSDLTKYGRCSGMRLFDPFYGKLRNELSALPKGSNARKTFVKGFVISQCIQGGIALAIVAIILVIALV